MSFFMKAHSQLLITAICMAALLFTSAALAESDVLKRRDLGAAEAIFDWPGLFDAPTRQTEECFGKVLQSARRLSDENA